MESLLAIDPIDSFVVDIPSLTLEYDVYTSISVARPGCSDVFDPHTQYGLWIAHQLVSVRRAPKLYHRAISTLAGAVGFS